jgi:hypothetical protein
MAHAAGRGTRRAAGRPRFPRGSSGPRALAGLCLSLLAISAALAQPGPGRRATLAVLPYAVEPANDGFAVIATEELRGELDRGRYQLVESERVDELMKQIALSHSRDFDPSMALELGRLAAADYVCIGEVALFGYKSTTALRVVHVEDGRIVMADCMHAESPLTQGDAGEAIKHAVRKLAARVEAAFPVEGAVAAVRGKEILLNVGTGDGVVKDMKFEVRPAASWLRDPVTGALLPRPERPAAVLVATRLSATGTSARVASGSIPSVGDAVVSRPLPLGILRIW